MSSRDVIFLNSAFEGTPRALDAPIAAGRVVVVEEEDLSWRSPSGAAGLIVTSHVDQVWLAAQNAWLESCLNAGGRIIFNGHVESEFLRGVGRYLPLQDRRVAAFQVSRLNDHSIWQGYEGDELTFRKGVAGFYGRGHNPMPPGAVAINLLDAGKEAAPIDWEWERPQGGRVISHAGNDLWVTFEDLARNSEIASRMVRWLEGNS